MSGRRQIVILLVLALLDVMLVLENTDLHRKLNGRYRAERELIAADSRLRAAARDLKAQTDALYESCSKTRGTAL